MQYHQYFNPENNYLPNYYPQNFAPQFCTSQNIPQQLGGNEVIDKPLKKKVENINETIKLEKAITDFNGREHILPNINIIMDIASAYCETFPIASVLYEKSKDCGENKDKLGQYIDMNNSDCKTFKLNDRILLNKKKIGELEGSVVKIEESIKISLETAIQEIKDMENKKEERKRANYIWWKEFFIAGLGRLGDKTTGAIYSTLHFFINGMSILLSKWTSTFSGFVIFVIIVILIYFIFGTKRNKNNNFGSGQQTTSNNFGSGQQTTSNNIFDYNSYFFQSISNNYNSFIGDMSSTTNRLNSVVNELTQDLPDDIVRENDENSRGADNLYHFNGKDLNFSNKVDNYNVNAVYSIYKPTNIIQKNFEIQWKKVNEGNGNESKYVLDCIGDDKKDYLEPNCSVKIKPVIQPEPIEPEKEIYITQI